MEIRVLRNFLTLTEKKTMSDAAKELYMTQPNLSRQLADLEKELGRTLFERNGKRLIITNEGRYLKRQARRIVAIADETITTLSTFDEAEHGVITIAESIPLGNEIVSQAIGALSQQCPDIFFENVSANSSSILDAIERNLIDFGIVLDHVPLNKFNHIGFSNDSPWGILTHKDSRLAMLDCVRPSDIKEKSLLVPKNALKGRWFSSWLGDSNIASRSIGSYDLPNVPLSLAETGICDIVIPESLASRLSEESVLCFRPLVPRIASHMSLVWGNSSDMTPSAKLFLATVREALEK